MKTFNEFQKFACETWFGPKDEFTIAALGVTGEAGEVADKIKKILRGDKGIPVVDVVKEIGDVLFYCAILCDRFDYSLQERPSSLWPTW